MAPWILAALLLVAPAWGKCAFEGSEEQKLLGKDANLAEVSTDLIVHTTIKYPECAAELAPLKKAYLERLGLVAPKTSDSSLFRALAVPQSEFAKLQEKVKKAKAKAKLEGSAYVASVYGAPAGEFRGVWTIGFDKKAQSALKDVVNSLCETKDSCPFFDEKKLFRVQAAATGGMAAYIPEYAVLLLDRKLLARFNCLDQFVIVHELAHELGSAMVEGFAAAGGWKKDSAGKWSVTATKKALMRNDELTRLSDTSKFSILPDAVYVGEGPAEGFVTGKAYEESLKRNDPSEDFADSVAAYVVMPSRFCYDGKNLAPRKFDFIEKMGFLPRRNLDCSSTKTK